MRFAILTQTAPPEICGIGDHSIKFAENLCAAGNSATVIARQGDSRNGVIIIPGEIDDNWFTAVVKVLDSLGIDELILQYTPLLFSGGRWSVEKKITDYWRVLATLHSTSLIVHETYFREWWRPSSLVRGTVQKSLLVSLARSSKNVFTASQPLQEEMAGWGLAQRPMLLPIGSNIPKANINLAASRLQCGISQDEVVLTLFGGGNALKWAATSINSLEVVLNAAKISHTWILLGGICRNWFTLNSRVVLPGRLSASDVSAHLQMTDIFLMPHVPGLSAKRGTLMAALEHGLPVVGTKGAMTDSFWSNVPGVFLSTLRDTKTFTSTVVGLSKDKERRRVVGRANSYYFDGHFAWNAIVKQFIEGVSVR